MLRLTVRGLWAHKLRFALTGLAVVLGVAFMTGTTVLTDTMGATFDSLFETSNEGIDVVVEREAAIDGDMIEAHQRVDAALIDRIRTVDGVAGAAGSIQGFAQIVRADGSTGTTNGLGVTIGTNWIDDSRLNPFTLLDGRAPGSGEVVLDKATIDREGWSLGDTVTVFGKAGPSQLVLVGSAAFGEVDGLPGTTLVAVSTATAQHQFGQVGHYDAITVAGDGTVTNDDLAATITSALGDDRLRITTGEADTAEQQASFKEDLRFFSSFLLAFAYIALFVGVFIIHNTFSIIVVQRMKEMAMLRAIGARRRQVLRAVLLESTLVGAFASGVGLVAGVGMSFVLRSLLNSVGLDIPGGDIVIEQSTITTAFMVGVGVTVLSSFGPAWKASRVAPIAALRDVAVDRTGSSPPRTASGIAITAAGALAFSAGLGADDATSALQQLGIGSVLIILGVFVLGPVLARPAMHVLGAALPLVSGTTGRLARENAKRNPRRTAATASALMIGVALVGFITVIASSTKASTAAAIDRSLRADYIVDSGQWGTGGFAPAIEADLAAVDAVELLSPLRVTPVGTEHGTTEVQAVDTAVIDRLVDLDVSAGSMLEVGPGAVAISRDDAEDQDVSIGDTVLVTFAATGGQPLVVRAVYDDETVLGGGFVVDLATYEANVSDQYDRQVWVQAADGVDATASAAAMAAALERWPNAELQDQASFKESISQEIDQVLNLIYGLLALAVVIALIGIANTLALSVHERTRELGLLRAVGMTRRQVRTAIRWESVLIAMLGTAFGFVLAVGGAWGMVRALDSEGVATFAVPGAPLAMIVGLAALAGVLAALGPARRAARLNVLAAIGSA